MIQTIVFTTLVLLSAIHQESNALTHSTTSTSLKSKLVDETRLKTTIANGRVYQHFDFVNEEQVQSIIDDIDRLRKDGLMKPSGLSNTLKNNQNFGEQDRATAPAPWWVSSLEKASGLNVNDEESCQENDDVNDTIQSVIDKIQALRLEVSSILDRPTMGDATLSHECYYSRSTAGAYLPRHMDESHEELKGPRGWMLPSRRSISWLIYLSDVELLGGELRSFPQQKFNSGKPGSRESGSHNGNLQVGWVDMAGSALPVYLDSWFNVKENNDESLSCILYVVPEIETETNTGIQYITRPWNNDSIQLSTSNFLKIQAKKDSEIDSILFIKQEYAKDFRLIEDRESWENGPPQGSTTIDITPARGSLVLFDSVSVPHEVLKVERNTRSAIAGWFHEETQQFPTVFS